RQAWERGVVLAGISAGALCWFETGVTDSLSPELVPWRDGLGLLPGSFCPHYDAEPDRRPAYHRFAREHRLPAGYAADDLVALHFEGAELAEVVTSRAGAAAYHVEADGDAVSETRIEPRVLRPGP
ncbi:MAG: Type 1 glutamine amidotransferase-like domain-containing protein, partial [Solirubrobacterales bacterium]